MTKPKSTTASYTILPRTEILGERIKAGLKDDPPIEGIAPASCEDRKVCEMELSSHLLLEKKMLNEVGSSKLCRRHFAGTPGSAKSCNLFSYFKQKNFNGISIIYFPQHSISTSILEKNLLFNLRHMFSFEWRKIKISEKLDMSGSFSQRARERSFGANICSSQRLIVFPYQILPSPVTSGTISCVF